ncbi:MAG: hypothetical protein NTW10_02970 [Bacteroidetes bacterium]|nr:hypothetical protein [Bacteroidota bacterium]
MKNILFSILILVPTLSFTTGNEKLSGENGMLSGTVTCKDYYELSNHADAGSEIYAINEADVKSTQYGDIGNVIDSFQGNKSDYSLAVYNTLDIARITKLHDNFDAASKFAFNYISGFRKLPATVRTSADGKGNYKLNLRPGRYYVVVISGLVKSNNIVESKGNIEYKIVDIRSAGETHQNISFEKSENSMVLLLTARQRQGC